MIVGQRVVIDQDDIAAFGGLTGSVVKIDGHLVTVLLDPYKDRYYNPSDRITFNHRVAFGYRAVKPIQ